MEVRPLPAFLVAALVGAAVYAAVHKDEPAHVEAVPEPPPPASAEARLPPGHPDPGALPPNHPPIGSGAAAQLGPGGDQAPAIAWKPPPSFREAESTSTMRIATYTIAAVAGDSESAELTVVRAGGSTDANVDRWVRQFDDAGKETRTEKTIAGFKVTIVEVSGTFLGGAMSPMGAPAGKKGWSLLGAIVETPGSPYFFKMTGPAATVAKARPAFVAMLEGIEKT